MLRVNGTFCQPFSQLPYITLTRYDGLRISNMVRQFRSKLSFFKVMTGLVAWQLGSLASLRLRFDS